MAVRLGLPTRPYWIDLADGVRVFVDPLDTALYEAARYEATNRLAAIKAARIPDAADDAGGEDGAADQLNRDSGKAQMFFTQALAAMAITAWEGVYPEEGDDPLPVGPAAVAELMRLPRMAETFLEKYTAPHHRLLTEGKTSGLAPNGTSATGPDTARGAGTKTSPAPGASGA